MSRDGKYFAKGICNLSIFSIRVETSESFRKEEQKEIPKMRHMDGYKEKKNLNDHAFVLSNFTRWNEADV